MLLIATDEAGYGPKLGPLVVVASAGRIESGIASRGHDQVVAAFEPMTRPVMIGNRKVRIDDSKSVYKSCTGLAGLHHVISASHHWCNHSFGDVNDMIRQVASNDHDDIADTSWLDQIEPQQMSELDLVISAIQQWRSAGFELLDIQARIITAKRFNQSCLDGLNKADLLTQSTLGLVQHAVHQYPDEEVQVFCDRHGGRRYYSNAIKRVFPEGDLRVILETKSASVYQVTFENRLIKLAFTVKGDRFAPVALSSMHAKYMRERLMEALNAYFQSRHIDELPLKPTAGYPVDADRFLEMIGPIIEKEGIAISDLVRTR